VRMAGYEDSDVVLLRASARDRAAFGAFYRMHAVAVYRWFRARVDRDPATAMELTAETFAEALRSLPRFRGGAAGDGTAWLFGIARNLGREYHRSRRVRERARRSLAMPTMSYVDNGFAEVDGRLDAGRLHDALQEALSELPGAQRDAVWLRVVAELDYDDIAAAMQSSKQAVRLHVFRGLRTLRSRLALAMAEKEC